MTEDEELAEQLIAQQDKENPVPRRRMSDWSPTVELLSAILDRLAELAQITAALGGAKPRKVARAPYPATAMERVRNRNRITAHRSLVARVLPRPASSE